MICHSKHILKTTTMGTMVKAGPPQTRLVSTGDRTAETAPLSPPRTPYTICTKTPSMWGCGVFSGHQLKSTARWAALLSASESTPLLPGIPWELVPPRPSAPISLTHSHPAAGRAAGMLAAPAPTGPLPEDVRRTERCWRYAHRHRGTGKTPRQGRTRGQTLLPALLSLTQDRLLCSPHSSSPSPK